MVSSRSSKNTNFNRVLSLALCVGVAFLLLAGSVFAGTTALDTSNTVNAVALQVGKANTTYTIPAAASYSAQYNRTMGVARQVASGDFFIDVNLQNNFVFAAGRLPLATDVTLGVAGGGTIGAVTIWSGGTASSNTVRFRIPVTGSFTTAPTFYIATAGWTVTDVTGFLSGTSPVTTQIEIKTFDANTGADLDNGGINTANFISAVNGLPSAAAVSTTAIVDTSASSGRKNFVATAPDTITKDNGATIAFTVGNAVAGGNPVHRANGTDYTLAAGDKLQLRIEGPLSGVSGIIFNDGAAVYVPATGAGSMVTKAVAAADRTNGYVVLEIAGNNDAVETLANTTSAALPLTIQVDGTNQLTSRNFTIKVDTSIAFNPANNSNMLSPVAVSSWGINGTVLMANWASANTSAFKSRIYLFNSTATDNATVILRVIQIPISALAGQYGAQIGSTVTLDKTLNAGRGMTIRLEDVLTAANATDAEKQGPDSSYNVAVEITVYAQGTGLMNNGGVTGYTQTFNSSVTMSFGTSPLVKVQPLP